MMDVISLLKKDHAEVRALFKEADGLSDKAIAAREKLFAQIAPALKAHAEAEETLFYPALKAKTKPATEPRDEVLEAYEEHAIVKTLISQLERLDPKDESYKAKLQVLGEAVDHHATEEETEMFKQARQLLTKDELAELGEQVQALKDRAKGGRGAPVGSAR